MNNDQSIQANGMDAQQLLVDKQVNLFLFDLKNEAIEQGFKTDDTWSLEMATEAEMTDLKRHHYPLILLRLQPNVLLTVFKRVKTQLRQSLGKEDDAANPNDLALDEKKYLAAYRAKAFRR